MKPKKKKAEAPKIKAAWTEVKPPVAYGIEPFEIDGEIVAYQVRGPRIIAHRTDAGDALTLCRMLQNAHDAGYERGAMVGLGMNEWKDSKSKTMYAYKWEGHAATVKGKPRPKRKGAKNG